MKQFVYFQNTEGGMDTSFFVAAGELADLRGWMTPSCRADDTRLVAWLETAEVGDYFTHRLGDVVRLKDAQE